MEHEITGVRRWKLDRLECLNKRGNHVNNVTSVTLGQNDHFEDRRTLNYEENSLYKIGLQTETTIISDDDDALNRSSVLVQLHPPFRRLMCNNGYYGLK